MTTKEAAIILATEHIGDTERMELAKQMGARALMRMTATQPSTKAMIGFNREVAAELCCPTCGGPVTNYWVRNVKPAHCQFCGQALDWGKAGKSAQICIIDELHETKNNEEDDQ